MTSLQCQKCGFEINFLDNDDLMKSHCDDFRIRVRKYWKPQDL